LSCSGKVWNNKAGRGIKGTRHMSARGFGFPRRSYLRLICCYVSICVMYVRVSYRTVNYISLCNGYVALTQPITNALLGYLLSSIGIYCTQCFILLFGICHASSRVVRVGLKSYLPDIAALGATHTVLPCSDVQQLRGIAEVVARPICYCIRWQMRDAAIGELLVPDGAI
jgi:hypothetical protein